MHPLYKNPDRIDNLISLRLNERNVSQDVSNNNSFSASPHVPIQLSLGSEQPDPSQSSSQQYYGKSGGEPEESVRGECASSLDLVNWISDLHSAGVCIPEQVENLVRPVSSLGSELLLADSLPSESQPANLLPSFAQSAHASVTSNHPAPNSASESSQGLFHSSSLFGSALNHDRSSGSAEPSHRVLFSLPPLV